MQRVIVYIDGFNLYYGLRERQWRRYYWLDIHRLAENLLRSHQKLIAVRYFTTRIAPRPKAKRRRQDTFIEALETLPDLTIHFGRFLSKERTCLKCGETWQTYEEKMTDVNIAVELLGDAQDDLFDTAIIVSGDSDLVGPISTVLRRFPDKKVVVAFPPMRFSKSLHSSATSDIRVDQLMLRNSQLPAQIVKPDGYTLKRPPSWR